jgi:shikimate dehydrogenase|tara:strand:- start:35 stop:829 length:795 start_codon:yes stop_codon:yes gene_type:complete
MKKYLVIGNPIEHSLSPMLHNYWFKQYNIEAQYEKKQLSEKDLKNIITDVRNDKISGINVTVPFKKSIIPFLDKLTVEATKTQSVNTIFKVDNEIRGHNTDIGGFVHSLDQLKFKTKGKKAFILGAGGVTSSIIFALGGLGALKIFVSNRTKKKAEELKKLFPKIEILDWGKKPSEFDIVVNTTSVGLKENEKIELDFSDCKDKLFYDVIYNPSQTKFLLDAQKFKNETQNGLGMFIYQAQESFEIWHGFPSEVDEKIYTMLHK